MFKTPFNQISMISLAFKLLQHRYDDQCILSVSHILRQLLSQNSRHIPYRRNYLTLAYSYSFPSLLLLHSFAFYLNLIPFYLQVRFTY